jgi:hypothetical protein
MWWNPAESGWGVNIILQNSVVFATFFVYDTNHNPVWYTAPLYYQGNFVWSGNLYATAGPWFGGPFPPGVATIRQGGAGLQRAVAVCREIRDDYNKHVSGKVHTPVGDMATACASAIDALIPSSDQRKS